MSSGERSCVNYGKCNHKIRGLTDYNCKDEREWVSCDVDCPYYEWNRETEPDSVTNKEI